MNSENISVEIHLHPDAPSLKAHADVRIELPDGSLTLYGFSIIEKDGKAAWVGFPSKEGRTRGKYFAVAEADGELRKKIVNAILEEFEAVRVV